MRAVDSLSSYGPVKSKTITKSDSTTYSPTLRGILIESAGALKIGYSDGTTDEFASGGLAVGVWHPIYDIAMVYSTGTDAQVIHAGKDD